MQICRTTIYFAEVSFNEKLVESFGHYFEGFEKYCCAGLFNLRFFTPPCSTVSSAEDSDLSEYLFFPN